VLGAVGHDAHIREGLGRPAQPLRLAALALDEGDRGLRPRRGQREAREARPAADVDGGRGRRARVGRSREAVEQVPLDALLETLDGGEVLPLEGDAVEQGDQPGGGGRRERRAELGRPGGQPLGGPGFT
jgi:hypothetical protein